MNLTYDYFLANGWALDEETDRKIIQLWQRSDAARRKPFLLSDLNHARWRLLFESERFPDVYAATADWYDTIPQPPPSPPVPPPVEPPPNRTPDPPPGQRLPLPYEFALVEQTSLDYPIDLQQNQDTWTWLDILVERLRRTDTRWGYNRKPNGEISKDVVDYHYSSGGGVGSTDVYIIDVIVGSTGANPQPGWTNQTGRGVGTWVYPRGE